MLFITNRVPKQSHRSRAGRDWTFADSNAVSNSVYFCEWHEDGSIKEILSRKFFTTVRDSGRKHLLLYIHGFSNQPDDVFKATKEMQNMADHDVLVIPMIWPCDNDFGVVKDYWDDQKSADATGMAFGRVLGMFYKWTEEQDPENPCTMRVSVLAHSMGNRVLRESLGSWDRYDLSEGVPMLFRNTFLVAADVVNETLHRGNRGEVICNASRNVVVYYASDDLALRSSKVTNLKNRIASRRLGHTGPEDMRLVPDNVYAVDCDNFNIRYDTPKGHTYFREDENNDTGVVFRHISACIDSGRVEDADSNRRLTLN
ncbi:MAG: alpha/beta hydrolase [Gammaproteobacteria bacterium]|nr:alpha/beta hydrolase [Gammaproteobacteria bacterium]